MLKLSVTTGWTMEQIESMPDPLLREYMILNSVKPFLYEAQAQREGYLVSLVRNQNVAKKDMKTMYEIFPYLKEGLPDWLEDKDIKKVNEYLESLQVHLDFGSKETYYDSLEDLRVSITEEIQIQNKKDKVDKYKVMELGKTLENINSKLEDRDG